MKHLLQLISLGLLFAITTAFTVSNADPSDQTSAEIVESESGGGSQTILFTDNKTHSQIAKVSVINSSLGGPLDASDLAHILWNPKHTAFVLQSHRSPKDLAVFVYLQAPGTTTNCYFSDSHPKDYSDLRFEWRSDTELTASYLDQNGKAWVEQWLIGPERFECRPKIAAGLPTHGA